MTTPKNSSGNGKSKSKASGLLDLVEIAGNKLPDPSILFLLGALLVMVASAIASLANWQIVKKLPSPVTDPVTGETTIKLIPSLVEKTELNELGQSVVVQVQEILEPVNLLTSDGIYWAFTSMIDNFMSFPPLGIVLVGMLGIGVAERTGLISSLLKLFMLITPSQLLTPAMVFIGVNSSLATDAGYVVLPPLAALLFKAVGRSPIVGIAAVFAGVSGGFGANLIITSLDPLLAGLSTTGAKFVDVSYIVSPNANWLFNIASTFVVTLVGWGVTHWIVEPRFARKPETEGGPSLNKASDLGSQGLSSEEVRAMSFSALALFATLSVIFSLVLIPGFPLNGKGAFFDRWVEAIVPLLFIIFLIPGLVYGISAKVIGSTKDLAKLMIDSMAAMAPIIVLAFFAAQFVEYFRYSNLGAMLAISGGEFLAAASLPTFLLIIAFILLTAIFNLFIGSMSAKYALFAPIFVPMLMLVGISPELTQVAYRIGDSISNIITPLNAYLVIILVFMQKYDRSAGMGTLIATMLPYTIALGIFWTLVLGLWMGLDIPLGIPFDTGPLSYPPSGR
jgi:aminobenzoyl-glutamate transport protein